MPYIVWKIEGLLHFINLSYETNPLLWSIKNIFNWFKTFVAIRNFSFQSFSCRKVGKILWLIWINGLSVRFQIFLAINIATNTFSLRHALNNKTTKFQLWRFYESLSSLFFACWHRVLLSVSDQNIKYKIRNLHPSRSI